MTDLHKAAEMAVKALERADKISGFPNNKNTLAALREALAAPVVPIGYIHGQIEWAGQQTETVVKITRQAQPRYGFVYPIFAAAPKPKEQTT